MESNPDRWFRRAFAPLWESAVEAMAAVVGARAKDTVFVMNATAAVNAVVNTLHLGPGTACLVTNQTYEACAHVVQNACEKSGATFIVMNLDRATLASYDAMAGKLVGTLREHPTSTFALLDHITSPTAVLMPVKRLCSICHEHGVAVMVDGAHAPGTVQALAVPSYNADWYTGSTVFLSCCCVVWCILAFGAMLQMLHGPRR